MSFKTMLEELENKRDELQDNLLLKKCNICVSRHPYGLCSKHRVELDRVLDKISAVKECEKIVRDAIDKNLLNKRNVIHDVDDCECCENVHKRGYALKEELGISEEEKKA